METENNEREKTEELLAELIKRGATMEQIALLKDPTANTPAEALQVLQAGNARFLSGHSGSTSIDINQRRAQIISQTPFAIVLGCSDSRVPVEIIFDVGPGDIFSIRVAGNVAEPATLGSIEYAVSYLKVHLIVVLGHEGCGVIAATLQDQVDPVPQPEWVQFLMDKVRPSVDGMPEIRDGKARMREAITRNVWHQKAELEKNPVVAKAIAQGRIAVVGAYYSIGSGAVDFLEA